MYLSGLVANPLRRCASRNTSQKPLSSSGTSHASIISKVSSRKIEVKVKKIFFFFKFPLDMVIGKVYCNITTCCHKHHLDLTSWLKETVLLCFHVNCACFCDVLEFG